MIISAYARPCAGRPFVDPIRANWIIGLHPRHAGPVVDHIQDEVSRVLMILDLEDARPVWRPFCLDAVPNDLLDCLEYEFACHKRVPRAPLVDLNANTKTTREGFPPR